MKKQDYLLVKDLGFLMDARFALQQIQPEASEVIDDALLPDIIKDLSVWIDQSLCKIKVEYCDDIKDCKDSKTNK